MDDALVRQAGRLTEQLGPQGCDSAAPGEQGRSVVNGRRCTQLRAASSPFISASGVGGQPGILASTGITFSTAPQLA